MTIEENLNPDFLDVLKAFGDAEVEFLIVGAYALAAHGIPRATGDIDLWVRPSEANAQRVVNALTMFGALSTNHGVSLKDFTTPGTVYPMGLFQHDSTFSPKSDQVITRVRDESWRSRLSLPIGGHQVDFL